VVGWRVWISRRVVAGVRRRVWVGARVGGDELEVQGCMYLAFRRKEQELIVSAKAADRSPYIWVWLRHDAY